MRWIECVPNFSEGRDRAVLDAIAAAVQSTDGVRLLDVDPGLATNRTVFTFVGAPDAVQEAAFRAIRTAAERIDMRKHRGEHARIGATDVCPFVPLDGASMDECVRLARRLGERVGTELAIPVYLYEEAATRPERRNLATIRAGEYEGLEAKLQLPEWQPDFGPVRFHPRAGATVIGAREFLVAYNVNLNTRDKKLAHDIALDLREAGRALRDADGKFVRDAQGATVQKPGRFPHVKAVGWYIEEYGRAQISINLTNLKITPLHAVFDAACAEAERRGLRVTGSEIVGLVPRAALLDAGRHYLARQGRSIGVPEHELVHIAVRSLGLDEISPFDPATKVVEYCVRDTGTQRWRSGALDAFVDALSTDSPVPGGGSVAAVCGALAAALAAMVANLTFASLADGEARRELERLAVNAQEIKEGFLVAIDADATAFAAVLAAMRLPRADAAAREVAVRQATRGATRVPLDVLERCAQAAALASTAARLGTPRALSDAGVAALCAATAAESAYYNVLINLANLNPVGDADFVAQSRAAAKSALDSSLTHSEAARTAVRTALEAPR